MSFLLAFIVLLSGQTSLHLDPVLTSDFAVLKEFVKGDPIYDPTKVIEEKDRVYILDTKGSQIHVFDIHGKFLSSIGRPGQGPGDLESPSDFVFSNNEIWVLNPTGRRVEVFDDQGTWQRRVTLNTPKTGLTIVPRRLLVDSYSNLYIANNFSASLVDVYSSAGDYKASLLKRSTPMKIPGKNIGNCSDIQWSKDLNSIVHFDYFAGRMDKISTTGYLISSCAAADPTHKVEFERISEDIKSAPRQAFTGIQVFSLWSDRVTIDDSGNVIALLLLRKEEQAQKIYVFRPDGQFSFQYSPFPSVGLRYIFHSQGHWYLVTGDNRVLLVERRTK